MGDSATIDIRGDNADLKQALEESRALFEGFGSKVKAVAVAAAAAFAVDKIVDFGREAVRAFAEGEKAAARLDAVVKATGATAGFSATQMRELVKAWASTTTFDSTGLSNAAAALAAFTNIRGDIFKDTMKAAMDMATVLNMDLTSAVNQVARAIDNPIQGLGALTKAGFTFTDSQREAIKVMIEAGDMMGAQRLLLQEIETGYGGAAEAIAGTFGGAMDQMKKRFGDIVESIGEALVPAVDALSEALGAAATVIENVVAPAIASAVEWLAELWSSMSEQAQPILSSLADGLIAAFTGMQVAIEEWSNLARLAIYGFTLAWVKQLEIVKHWLTTVIPDLLAWFGRNWVQVFTDLANATAAIFTNMWDNILMFFENVFKWLSGEETDWRWKSLLTGFESTLEELPKIAERSKGDLEKSLEDIMAGIADEMGGAFEKRFEENRSKVRGAIESAFKPKARGATADDVEPGAFKAPTLDVQVKPKINEKEKEALKKELGELDLNLGVSNFKASFVGLEELNKRIQAAAASGGPDVLPELTKKQTDAIVKGAVDTVLELERQTKASLALLTKEDERQAQLDEMIAAIKDIKGGLL